MQDGLLTEIFLTQNATVFIEDTELQVGEADGSVSERIMRAGSLANDVTITYGVTGDTATAGQDFVGGYGTVTMPAGVSEVTVPVIILDDTVAEPTEVAVFSLVNVQGATLWAPRTSRISILDNEAPAAPVNAEPLLYSDYDVTQQSVVTGLNQPIKLLFSPVQNSLAYVAEKSGVIRVADMTTGASSVMLDIRDQVNEHQDRGLLDIALHPDFANNPYLYAYYVADPPDTAGQSGNAGPDGSGNRYAQLVRYTADKATGFTTIVPGSAVVLAGGAGQSLNDISGGGMRDFTDPALASSVSSERYTDPAQPAPTVVNGLKQNYLKVDSASHAGGALAFGPDGELYVSTGDGTSFDYADPRTPDVQSLDSLSGKILRIDPMTGQGLLDNPYATLGTSLDSNRAKVFQLGLRNPFSMTFDQEGRLFITNTGWNSWEAIDMGGPGANFGWPYYEGGDGGTLLQTPTYRDFASASTFYAAVAAGTVKVTPAFRAFSHDSADPGYQVQAITGGEVVYSGGVYPAALQGNYFFSDFSGGKVYTVDVNNRTSLKYLYGGGTGGAPVDYVQGPDGYVYYVNIGAGEIGKLQITALPPPSPPGDAAFGTGPDTLILHISQDAYNGSAQYTVSIDGRQVSGLMTALALHGSGQADTVTVSGVWATGSHTATVTFLNGSYGDPTADRNLYLESAAYDGVTVNGAAVKLGSSGPASFGFAGGTNLTVGTGSDTLVLKVSQDAFQGNAQFTVAVDGQQVSDVLTASSLHGSGTSDTVNVLGNLSPGPHTVTVNFLNDLWDGSAASDRNLYVDSATYNEAAVSGAAQELGTTGPVSFGITDLRTTVTWSSGTTEASLLNPTLTPGDALVVRSGATVIAEGNQLAGVDVNLNGTGSYGPMLNGAANLTLSSATIGSLAVTYDPNAGAPDFNSGHLGHLDVFGQTTIAGSTTIGGGRPVGPGFLDAYVHGSDGILTLHGAVLGGASILTINGDYGSAVENDGNINIQGGANTGTVTILDNLQGTGTITGGADFGTDTASIRLGGDVGTGQTINLTQTNLQLDKPISFQGTLAGFNSGRASGVTLENETVTSTAYAQSAPGVGTLSVFTQDQTTGAAGATLAFHVAGDYASKTFAFTNDAAAHSTFLTLAA